MKGILVVLALLAVCCLAQDNPPQLEGQWDDTTCNILSNTQRLYRKRSVTYGAWDRRSQLGSWQYTETVYQEDFCSEGKEDYQIVITGTYKLSGKESDFADRFWHVDYTVTRKRMQVYNQDFADFLNDLPRCAFGDEWIPNVQQTIDEVVCPDLNLVSVNNCPVQYDIVRRQLDVVFLGELYAGEPPVFNPNCTPRDRPRNYDPYGLTLFGLPAIDPEITSFDLDPFINPPSVRAPSFDLTAHLGIGTNSASSVVASLAVVLLSLLALF
eukprot:CAMPEP_0184350752 /NCGR_PEP_ID=MMETSP1089-20130417/41257_1 /TAXON_ID=38269 ORGANISM="Gloeochaete wittrockiana, Strain SAG46.84" /NCGR_SAMPLE_ID=MMETSP1089 /ASSEMBLY_ACC=CAM_ASM_000445 /LENGTH=268 /DNA_ID=CAMNT_0026683761 /DNA_START=27 /DNA_END=833 /DNA_ORIENTATION=-